MVVIKMTSINSMVLEEFAKEIADKGVVLWDDDIIGVKEKVESYYSKSLYDIPIEIQADIIAAVKTSWKVFTEGNPNAEIECKLTDTSKLDGPKDQGVYVVINQYIMIVDNKRRK